MLELIHVGKIVDGERMIDDVCLSLSRHCINILLGPTLAGKTSLMRLMAGLDTPTAGDIRFDGRSVTGVSVQKRNVAMVYQQFINYPSLSVFENIASPLRVAKVEKKALERRVLEAAELLKIGDLLERSPAQLSGGQQQRVALARALVKRAELVLLDEPLANLDYKLREELRAELPRLFSEQGAVLVYATAEATEALQLGGNTAVLHEGRVTQYGATQEVFQTPADLTTAMVFSDPPLNTAPVMKSGAQLTLGEQRLPLGPQAGGLPDGPYTLGVRPYHIGMQKAAPDAVAISGCVTVNEITGSESYLHFGYADQTWVALVDGVHNIAQNEQLQLFLDPRTCYLFHPRGDLAHAPAAPAG
jgi:glycerol transport system ATP-binding protein